ncbi:hypothetical protein EVJ22_03345 [Exiguobacterium sp. SH0S7]|uniref:GAP family protein n=1 Tax=Exiguobacterium sp. SH0S7 TaxID=2510951 RepID=UPI00103A71A7|nr:GAP family protein [Exiguobacterium sp. SH0S7]TCI73445.1 hypothetical protein EVJ22_03345 [Exiguobacterium sp. SH0S7]
MNLEFILAALGLALLDSLNPATIATMMVLLPLVRKKWHASLFIVGTFVVYTVAGIAIYTGLDRLLRDVLSSWLERFTTQVGISLLVIGLGCLVYGAVTTLRLFRRIRANEPLPDVVGTLVRTVNPYSIIVLSVSSTFLDLPTALPLFGFVAILSGAGFEIIVSLIAFVCYGVVYIAPMAMVYGLYIYFHGDARYVRFERSFRHLLNVSSVYLIPVFLFLLGGWLVFNGIGRLGVDM